MFKTTRESSIDLGWGWGAGTDGFHYWLIIFFLICKKKSEPKFIITDTKAKCFAFLCHPYLKAVIYNRQTLKNLHTIKKQI